jgi:hypothetical protein
VCVLLAGLAAGAWNGQAVAAFLNLVPADQTASPGDLVTVDLIIGGLGDFAPDSLGDFDVDIAYEPGKLSLSGFVLGDYLGDIGLGEAGDFSLGDSGGGLLNLAVVSFLEADDLSCVFCIPPYLDDLQPSSFVLASIEFLVGVGLTPGTSTPIDIARVNALGDGFGIPLSLDEATGALVRRPAAPMPAPGIAILMMTGLGVLRLLRRSG